MDLQAKLFDYFAQRHFDNMRPEVRARFDDYAKNEDFKGNMKHWYTNFVGAATPDLVNSGDHYLSDEEWILLYDAYQSTFQNMDIEKDRDLGYASSYDPKTKDFISKWFGPDKVFIPSQANDDIDKMLFKESGAENNLADFLKKHEAKLKPIFTNKYNSTLKDVFSNISYQNFVEGLEKQRYNSDSKFRRHVFTVVFYIVQNGPRPNFDMPNPAVWPPDVGYEVQRGGIVRKVDNVLTKIYNNPNTDTWFAVPDIKDKIKGFKDNYIYIFDTLLTNSKIRENFLAQAEENPIVVKPLREAISQTDYENPEVKDYLEPKYEDEKHWIQELKDKLDDTYEYHFRRFVNPSRGTRLFFSPWVQDIIKAFDKVKIKPTDGLEGILSKKDEIASKLKTKTPSEHFKWFTDTIEKLKKDGMDKAVEGALRNGKQMQHLVSAIISEAALVTPNKVKEAKTALEILSVAKYGLSSSRTFDKLKEAVNGTKLFSDEKLSWNKNEGVKLVTNAMDKTAGFAIKGAGLVATGIRNLVAHNRMKIDGDITKNEILNKAHRQWDEKDLEEELQPENIDKQIFELEQGHGLSGREIVPYMIKNKKDILDAEKDKVQKEKLKRDIELYEKLVNNLHNGPKKLEDIQARREKREKDGDPFKELVAYWNMLETASITHAFGLGSMQVKRKAMLKDYNIGNSIAQQTAKKHLDDFNSYSAS